MKVAVTYMIHSCFTVELDDRVLLFDYPGRRFSRQNMDEIVRSKLKGKKAIIFASHSHSDHFNPDVLMYEKTASGTHFVLSDDIPLHGKTRSPNITMIGPEENLTLGDISIETFESNDAGVAFLIRYRNKTIYYGGDLAKWDWPEWSVSKQADHVKVFEDVLKILKETDLDLAFSNMDERLESWAGPLDFIRSTKPRFFVPMHTFGNEQWVEDMLDKDIPSHTTVFKYEKTGDSVEWDL
ncbi:MAG: MBL fold metallo-hydrolase [Candidatus Saliniplasma sp.]